MKEVPLQLQLDLLDGPSESGNINFEFDDTNELNQCWVIPCHLHCSTDQDNQTNHHKCIESKDSESLYENCTQHGEKLRESNSKSLSEIIQKVENSPVFNDVHLLVNDETNEQNASRERIKCKCHKSGNAHLLLQNNTSSALNRNMDAKDGKHNDHFDSDCNFHSQYSTLLGQFRNSCTSILGDPYANSNKPAIVPSLNIYTNNQAQGKLDICHIHLWKEYPQNQKTQIGHSEIFQVGENIKSDKITSLSLEFQCNVANANSNDQKVESSQQCLECHVSPTENIFINQNESIQLQEKQDMSHQNIKLVVSALSGTSTDKHQFTQRKNNPNDEEGKEKTLTKLDKSLSESFCSKYSSCRWKLAYLCFLARFIQTALRQCMGIAIIGMTLKTEVQHPELFIHATNNSLGVKEPETTQEFEWSSTFEGVVLASFNIGSIITPIIVGYLTTRYGGRTLMTVCLLGGGMFSVLLPVAARSEPALIIVFRIITGIALSGTDSLIQAMWARWAPLYEKASLSACAYTGLSSAGVLTYLVCGYIVSIGGEGRGWPYIFYIFGSLCLLLAPLWYVTVYGKPEDHPSITKKELAIITFNKQSENFDCFKKMKEINTPWRRILKSSAVWAIVMGQITHKWVLSFMLSYLPRYFSDLFDFDVKTDGLYSSLPFAGRIISGAVAGYVSDWMLRKGVSTRRTRKFFQATGCCGCAIFSLLIAFTPSLSSAWSISLLVLALSCQDLTSVAFRINLLDIAPRYAGVLNGVVSTIATLTSIPAPVITSLLISGGSRQGWQVLFCLVAALNIIGAAIFVIFAKGEIQDWAQSPFLNLTIKPGDEMVIFTLDTSNEIKQLEQEKENLRALWAFKSLPIKIRKCRTEQLGNVGRRATLDVGSVIKRVQNHAYFNLALADL